MAELGLKRLVDSQVDISRCHAGSNVDSQVLRNSRPYRCKKVVQGEKMSYLRWGSRLPSGKKSTAYIIFDGENLINFSGHHTISKDEVKSMLRNK